MKHLFNDPSKKSFRKQLRSHPSKPEQKLWYHLRNRQLRGIKFRRQVSIGTYIVDFFSYKKRLIIEVDGDSHFVSQEAEHNDKERENFLQAQGLRVIRFTNREIMDNLESCLDQIKQACHTPPEPNPKRGGI